MEGIILEIDEDQILLAQDLSRDDYENFEESSEEEPENDGVIAEKDMLNLIILAYEDAE